MRTNLHARVILLAVLGLASAVLSAAAADPGYWRCSGGSWVAVGEPRTPSPSRACGVEPAIPGDRAGCEQAGGTWGPAGIFPKPICRVPTSDGGRACADDGECEGRCLAALTPAQRNEVQDGGRIEILGACTPVRPVFGCMAIVEKGWVAGILCAD
jgi:hypothetical protein